MPNTTIYLPQDLADWLKAQENRSRTVQDALNRVRKAENGRKGPKASRKPLARKEA